MVVGPLDPIKAFCSTEGGRHRIPVDQVLNDYYLQFTRRSGTKKFRLQFINTYFEGKYTSDIKNMETWLGVWTKDFGAFEREISIWMDYADELPFYTNSKSA